MQFHTDPATTPTVERNGAQPVPTAADSVKQPSSPENFPNHSATSSSLSRIPRERDGHSTKARDYTFHSAFITDANSNEVERVCACIEATEPARAAEFREWFTRLRQTRARLDAQQAYFDNEAKAAQEALAAATKDDLAETVRIDAEIRAWSGVCEARFSRLLIPYDAKNPSDSMLLTVEKMSPAEAAVELELPYSENDGKPLLPPWVDHASTVAVGAAGGIAAGLLWNFLTADQMDQSLTILIFWILLGIALTYVAKYAVRESFAFTARLFYTPGRWSRAIAVSVALAMLVGGVLLAADALTQYQGLITWQNTQADQLNGLVGGQTRPAEAAISWVLVASAVWIPFGYLIANAYWGARIGRHSALSNRIQAHFEKDFAKQAEKRRTDPLVRDALHAFNRRQAAVLRREETARRINAAHRAYKESKTQNEQLLQDRLDDLLGQQAQWDEAFKYAREECDFVDRRAQ